MINPHQVTYHFEIDKGILKAGIQDKLPTMECTISDINQLEIKIGLAKFQRADGQISGFELDSGRVRNLKSHRNWLALLYKCSSIKI